MTDNEIIKALECHKEVGCAVNCCEQCPILNHCDCSAKLAYNALDLINRQKAEIERLNEDKHKVARLVITLIEVAETEAVKKFAKRLKEEAICGKSPFFGYQYYQISDKTIDRLIKEMVGGGTV